MSHLTRIFTLSSLLLIPVLASGQAEEGIPTLALDCQAPGKTDVPNRDPAAPWFLLNAGEAPLFECRLDNLGTTDQDLLLLAEAQSGVTPPSAMGENVTVRPGPPERRRLIFPAPTVPGDYSYQFSLRDKATGQIIIGPIKHWGRLEGKLTASLVSVIPERSSYEWGETVTLSALITTPGEKALDTLGLSLTARLLDVNGGSCATLVERQPVVESQASYSLTLPSQGACTNTLEVSLHNSTGERQGVQQVALALPPQDLVLESKTSTPGNSGKTLWIIILSSLFLMVTVVILRRLRKHSRRSQV